MDQPTFGDLAFTHKKHRTRRGEVFGAAGRAGAVAAVGGAH